MISSTSYPQVAEGDSAYLSESPLNLVELLRMAHNPNAGAVVLFSGEVRINSAGKEVSYLEYEAHSTLASKMIERILYEASSKWSLNFAFAKHRVGKVEVGASAVIVITGSPHRKEAYMANRYIIDKIKHEVPIWKCEYFTDGARVWGGNCNCHEITGDTGKHVYEFAE